MAPRPRRAVIPPALALTVILAATACSGGDDDASRSTPTSAGSASAAAAATSSAAPAPTASTAASTPTPTQRASTAPTSPPTTVVVDDTGVPGLDSDDAFCAAWSRFGGSWQVVLAANAFGGPDAAARLEVLAAPVVGDAFTALFDAWPDELSSERDVVADAYFGAFQRRSADALSALDRAGAGADELGAISDVWVAALAARDPSNPVIEVSVPADLGALVDTAAADFAGQRTSLMEDPSMVITASTPLTDAYLATACPDQGAITGSDVIGG